jgi:hypothetical protein
MTGPCRIVCLTEEPTEVLYALGAQDRIVGISGFTVRPAAARREKPKVSAFTSAKIAEILALRPDFVIGFSDIQADIASALIKQGIEVWISNHRSVDGILDYVLRLGALVGEAGKARAYADSLRRDLDAVAAGAARLPARPKVYFEEWDEPASNGSPSWSVSPAARISFLNWPPSLWPKTASWPMAPRSSRVIPTSSSDRGAARNSVRKKWLRARAGKAFRRCGSVSCSKSNRPSSCNPDRRP